MNSHIVSLGETTMAVKRLGPQHKAGPELVWAHGWGQSGAALINLAQTFETWTESVVLDLPGFGASGLPPQDWGTRDYAAAIGGWLANEPKRKRIWIGYSYGGRIGLQIASLHPELINGMVLVAAAGLPRRRGLASLIALRSRLYAFKLAKLFTSEGPARDRLRVRFGSADFRNAGAMRGVFLRAVNENLSAVAARVRCPTALVYGREDEDTPPEIGERLHELISGSQLRILDGYNHHTILTNGRHHVVGEVRKLMESLV